MRPRGASPTPSGRSLPECSPESERLIGVVAGRLEQRSQDVAVRLIHEVELRMPHLAGDDEFHETLVAVARGSVELISTMMRTWTDPSVVPPPHEALEWARGLVGRGVSMNDLLRVYRLGQATYQDLFYGEIVDQGADPVRTMEAMRACSAFSFAWIDAISTPLIEAYEDERDRRQQGAEAVRVETIEAILAGGTVDPQVAGARLGYDLGRRHVGFVVWTEGDGDVPSRIDLDEAVGHVARVLGGSGRPLLSRTSPRMTVGWTARGALADDVEDALATRLRGTGCRVAIGSVAEGMAGFRTSYEQANRARRVARLLRRGAHATLYADVAVEDLLTRDVDGARALATRTLGPLASDDDATRRLLTTLRVYLEEGQSLARASRRLGIHQNTIAYRVRRAVELAGQPDAGSKTLHAAVLLGPLLRDGGGDGEP
ncbi:MAG: helix-turn-helix domain-containing protein [Solirubrobacteraceae bacterium]|nr:helix-turn-helix domain-containing protein [Solirubrobacteraceae bacterium]